MKLGVALLSLAAMTAPAWADERTMFVNLGGTFGVGLPSEEVNPSVPAHGAEGVLMGRVFGSWELPPVPYRDGRGYRWRPSVAPEVVIGRLRIADHRHGDFDDNSATFLALGARLELGMSQHKGGLFQVSARGAYYLAARVGLLTEEHHTPLSELAIGQYLYAGDNVRFGVELALLSLFVPGADNPPMVPLAKGPWSDGIGPYTSLLATVYVGFKL